MRFMIFLAAASILGGGIGAAVSHIPGKKAGSVCAALLLAPLGLGLFAGAFCLRAHSFRPSTVIDRFFPDKLSKLVGCALLLLLLFALGVLVGAIRAGGLRPYLRRLCGSRFHRSVGLLFVGLEAGMLSVCVLLAGTPADSPLRLNEICCANLSLCADPDNGTFSDYIELFNHSDTAVNLADYCLSDNAKNHNGFRLPELTLEPGAFVLLWADGSGSSGQRSGTGIHLNFSLKPGETLWFSSPHGVLLDHVTVPESRKNVALSFLDGSWSYAYGTPGQTNDAAVRYQPATLDAPTLSLPGGFYNEAQTLSICAASNCRIYYTLDGSLPTEHSLLYQQPLTLLDPSDQPNRVWSQPNTTPDRSGVITEPVDKGMVIRAAAIDENGARSETVTAVYFVGERFAKYRNQTVLSLVAEPDDLFGADGIMVTGPEYDAWLEAGAKGAAPAANFSRSGPAWERDAVLTLFQEDGSVLLDTACGLRLQGDSSRVRNIKRFSLYARRMYGGSSLFSSPIFGDRFSHSVYTRHNVNEVMAQSLCAELGLGGQASRPVTVFLNGERYAESFLRERYDSQWFQSRFGVEAEALALIADGHLDHGDAHDLLDYQGMVEYAQTHDCSDPVVWAALQGQMDVENFATFVAANLYLNNTDWSIQKNYRVWRSNASNAEGLQDGRWRWLLFDMDACYWTQPAFADAPRASYNLFTYPAPLTEGSFQEMPLFRDLLENSEFRTLFAKIWLRLMNVDFSYEGALPLLKELSLEQDSFWPEFLRTRPDYAVAQLIDALELPGEAQTLTLSISDPAGGTLRLDTAPLDLSHGTWSGTWVTGLPLSLRAEAARGWHFVGWRGYTDSTSPDITLSPNGETALTAVFAPD